MTRWPARVEEPTRTTAVVTTTATTASEPSSFRFMSQNTNETILKNIENWKQERANAAAAKVERQRVKKARENRVAFNRGFGSIGDILSR